MYRQAAPKLVPDSSVTPPPADSVSQVKFAPDLIDNAYAMSATSWDGNLTLYQAMPAGQDSVQIRQAYQRNFGSPALGSAWVNSKHVLVTCGDKSIRMLDFNTNQDTPIGQHMAAARFVYYIPETAIIASGGFDGFIRYWDARQPRQVAELNLGQKIFAMDVRGQLCCAATAFAPAPAQPAPSYGYGGTPNKAPSNVADHVFLIDLSNPTQVFRSYPTLLKHQIRTIRVFSDRTGFIAGSVEGRCNFFSLGPEEPFAFRCHRIEVSRGQQQHFVFPINDIAFHPNPEWNTFATIGGDGRFAFWDKKNKNRLFIGGPSGGEDLLEVDKVKNSLTSGHFSHDGQLFGYSMSYDWSRGVDDVARQKPTGIFMHVNKPAEISPKK